MPPRRCPALGRRGKRDRGVGRRARHPAAGRGGTRACIRQRSGL